MDILQLILAAFSALVGFPALLTAVVNVLAFIKVPINPDAFYFWGNVAGFVVVGYFVFTGQLDILAALDSAFVGLARILVDVLILLGGTASALFFNFRMHTKLQSIRVSSFRK